MNINLEISKIKKTKKKYDDKFINLFVPIIGNNEQIKFFLDCLENTLKNNCNFSNIYIFLDKENEDGEKIINDFIDKYDKNFIIKLEIKNVITYNNIFTCINDYSNEINFNILIRSNIILPKQSIFHILPYKLKDNSFYCLSSMETINNKIWKDQTKLRLFYSNWQDAWIFKTPLKINFKEIPDIDFNIEKNELILNYYLSKKYKILNDTNSFKILKCHNQKINLDFLYKKNNSSLDTKKYLPENLLFDKINLDQFVKLINMSKEEIYNLKCELFEKKININ